MSIVSELERIVQMRADLLKQIATIDADLERARMALGGTSQRISRTVVPASHLRSDGSWPNTIMQALAVSEPQSLATLAANTHASQMALRIKATDMVRAGRLFSRRLPIKGRPYVYARTEGALPPVQRDEAGDAEPEQLSPVPTTCGASMDDTDSTGAVTDGSL